MSIQERLLQKGPVEKLGIAQRRIRILPDGRHVPTFEGSKHTPETREKMRADRVGKRKQEESFIEEVMFGIKSGLFLQEDSAVKI